MTSHVFGSIVCTVQEQWADPDRDEPFGTQIPGESTKMTFYLAMSALSSDINVCGIVIWSLFESAEPSLRAAGETDLISSYNRQPVEIKDTYRNST